MILNTSGEFAQQRWLLGRGGGVPLTSLLRSDAPLRPLMSIRRAAHADISDGRQKIRDSGAHFLEYQRVMSDRVGDVLPLVDRKSRAQLCETRNGARPRLGRQPRRLYQRERGANLLRCEAEDDIPVGLRHCQDQVCRRSDLQCQLTRREIRGIAAKACKHGCRMLVNWMADNGSRTCARNLEFGHTMSKKPLSRRRPTYITGADKQNMQRRLLNSTVLEVVPSNPIGGRARHSADGRLRVFRGSRLQPVRDEQLWRSGQQRNRRDSPQDTFVKIGKNLSHRAAEH